VKSKNSSVPELVLVTGFLGSGKTTFLKVLMSQYRDVHKGVIVNDFGKVAIDGSLLEEGIFKEEISGGSIFCSCRENEFVEALKSMIKKGPEIIFVETSGMSDPSGIERLLPIAGKVEYISAYCVVDAPRFLALSDIFSVVEKQVASSDVVIINKVDKATGAELERIKQEISMIGNMPQYQARYGMTGKAIPLFKRKKTGTESENHPDNRPKSLLIEWEGEVTIEQLKNFVGEILGLVLRVKGFCRTESGLVLVSGAGSSVEITLADKASETGLSVISERNKPVLKSLKETWERIFNIEMKIT
jgi:G3E family GTPase